MEVQANKKMNKLIKGQLVKVFTDPISCSRPEGNATLVKKIRNSKFDVYIERWTVNFLGDFRDQLVDRDINTTNNDPF